MPSPSLSAPLVGLALALLGACRPARASPSGATAEPSPPALAAFTPAPRYTATFEAADVGCRGVLSADDATATLTITPDHHATFELSSTPKDLLGDLRLAIVPPIAPPAPTTCRWAGTGTLAAGRWSASLERIEGASAGACGDATAPPLTLECRPELVHARDADGREHERPALRCVVVPPVPALPWWALERDLLLGPASLHHQLERHTLGGSSHTILLARPSPNAPPPTRADDLARASPPSPVDEANACVER